jgi:hypothetical protein
MVSPAMSTDTAANTRIAMRYSEKAQVLPPAHSMRSSPMIGAVAPTSTVAA